MKKFLVVFALFAAWIFVVSCGSGNSKKNDMTDTGDTVTDEDEDTVDSDSSDAELDGDTSSENPDTDDPNTETDSDPNTDQGRKQGDLYGECYPNGTCSEGLVCDTENNICIKDSDDQSDDDGDTEEPVPDDDADTGNIEPTEEEKCIEAGGSWNSGECTKSASCTELPENASWNTASSITQIWDGSSWTPTTTGSFNNTASTSECRYKCNTNYNWNSTNKTCDAAKQTVNCTTKPANTVWNNVSTVTQTWTGSAWSPSNTSTYNTTASTSECRYKCATGYVWTGSVCEYRTVLGNICTGQTSCYDASSVMTCPSSSSADFYGQDAQYTGKCTAQSFTSSNVVVDNNTKLTWEKSPSSDTYTWANRSTHCDELNSSDYGGKNNWRVPNPLELLTIVDNSRYNPATNSNFTGMPTSNSTYLWTSAEYKNASYAYIFSPSYGWYDGSADSDYLKTNTYKVLCVSGEEMQPATSANFTTQTISGSVVVTDSATGLMWQQEYVTGKKWQEALKYCEDLTYAGYSDWRLPNKNELASLVNYEKSNAPYSYFPGLGNDWFWSSSSGSTNDRAWYVDFYAGLVYRYYKFSANNVRCVR